MPTKKEFMLRARARLGIGPGGKNKVGSKVGGRATAAGEYRFTFHAEHKMQYYRLSRQKILSIIRDPHRREESIVPGAVAVMRPTNPKQVDGKSQWKEEIWVMFRKKVATKNGSVPSQAEAAPSHWVNLDKSLKKGAIVVISAWRYPGISPERNPIPEDILLELERSDLDFQAE